MLRWIAGDTNHTGKKPGGGGEEGEADRVHARLLAFGEPEGGGSCNQRSDKASQWRMEPSTERIKERHRAETAGHAEKASGIRDNLRVLAQMDAG